MKKNIFIFIAFSVFSNFSLAQLIPSTRQDCTRKCISLDPDNPKKARYEERLKSIREKKKSESDMEKLKSLDIEEKKQIDEHQFQLEDMCRTICADNPEA